LNWSTKTLKGNKMINLALTVREALWVLSKCETYDSTYDKIVSAIEKAITNPPTGTKVTVKSIPQDNFISAIRIIRNYTRWGLKDTKEWLDVVRGTWQGAGHYENGKYVSTGSYSGGKSNTLTITFGKDAIALAEELRGIGCVVRVGDA
jgi:hypothetical protein